MQHYVADIFGRGQRPDTNTFSLGDAYLKANHPRVVYLDFGGNGNFGHERKYGRYLDAAHKIDAMIGDFWNYLQQDSFCKNQTT